FLGGGLCGAGTGVGAGGDAGVAGRGDGDGGARGDGTGTGPPVAGPAPGQLVGDLRRDPRRRLTGGAPRASPYGKVCTTMGYLYRILFVRRATDNPLRTLPASFTRAEARRAGLPDSALYRLRDHGFIESIGRGLYRRTDVEAEADLDLVEIAHRASR